MWYERGSVFLSSSPWAENYNRVTNQRVLPTKSSWKAFGEKISYNSQMDQAQLKLNIQPVELFTFSWTWQGPLHWADTGDCQNEIMSKQLGCISGWLINCTGSKMGCKLSRMWWEQTAERQLHLREREREQKLQNPIKAILIGPLFVSSWQIDYPCMLWSGKHNGGEKQRKKWEGGVCFWLCWGGGKTHPANSPLMTEQWGKKQRNSTREHEAYCKETFHLQPWSTNNSKPQKLLNTMQTTHLEN